MDAVHIHLVGRLKHFFCGALNDKYINAELTLEKFRRTISIYEII